MKLNNQAFRLRCRNYSFADDPIDHRRDTRPIVVVRESGLTVTIIELELELELDHVVTTPVGR